MTLLEIKKREIASRGDKTLIDLLTLLSDSVADVRIPLAKNITDTLEVRSGIALFLSLTIDDIRSISNNIRNTSPAVPEGD